MKKGMRKKIIISSIAVAIILLAGILTYNYSQKGILFSPLNSYYVEAEKANLLSSATVADDSSASNRKKISYDTTIYVYGFAQFNWVWDSTKKYSIWTRQYRPAGSNRGIYLYSDKHVLIQNSWKAASQTEKWEWVYHGDYNQSQFGTAIIAKGDGKGGILYLDEILIADVGYDLNDICTDSDGGLDYYVKGEVSGNIGSGYPNEVQTYSDFCLSEVPHNYGTNNTLIERYCGTNYTDFTKSYECPNGCEDGACLEEDGWLH